MMIQCDTSMKGLGAALLQDGKPVVFSINNNNCDVRLKGIACNCLHYKGHDGNGVRYCLACQCDSRLFLN